MGQPKTERGEKRGEKREVGNIIRSTEGCCSSSVQGCHLDENAKHDRSDY